MSRGHSKIKKQPILADERFSNPVVTKFINYIMENGKKTVATKIVYDALDNASAALNIEQAEVFNQALKNVAPIVEVKSKRIGGANYQVPTEVNAERKNTLAMRWIITAARSSKGKPMAEKLSIELVNAYKGEGAAIKKKEDTHKMAEANKAFAHFARF